MVFLLLITCVFPFGILFSSTIVIQDKDDFSNPKSSAGEITIITPENKTYTEPDSGYYPATYGFENDLAGSDPMAMSVFEGAGYVDVADEVDGHKKVIEMYDGINSNHDELYNVFPLQTHGTVEFWIRSSDVTKANQFTLLDSNALGVYWQGIGWINLDGDDINYQDSVGWHTVAKTPYDNTWYHFKIEFECSTGSYQGLAQKSYRFYVNGEVFGDFSFKDNIENVTQVYFFTRGEDSNYRCYVDAVSYSWDSDYVIGDNMNEGLLLSYENTTSLDWQGYSLDGQANKTILGNKTIPMPAERGHIIQVFGNDTMGTMYQSNLRHFSVNQIPEYAFTYSREISINPSTPTNDYQIKIILNANNFNYSHVESDGRDIRFLDLSENQLSYWIETWDPMGSSIIWVKVPNSGTSKIEIQYGNPAADSLSNGINTFVFFDDFEGTSLNTSKWDTEIGTYCGITVSSGYVRIYSDAPNTFAELAFFGFTDMYFNQGSPGWIHPSESIAISLAEDTSWHTNEIRWTNLTSAPYYKNDVFVSEDTTLEDTTLTVRFLAHTAYSGPGTPWGAWIYTDDNTLGQMGRGLRTKTSVDITDISDLRVDWVAVFNYNESNPAITVGEEEGESDIIIVNNPIANSLYGTVAPDFNITITDPDYNFTWYSLDGGSTNVYSNETIGTIDQTEWEKQNNGTVTITFYANNSLGDIGHTAVTVRKDILAPLITIISPGENQVCGADAPTFDLTIIEHEIDSTWYTLDYGSVNVSFSGSTGTIDQTEWAKKGGGTVPIRFYANDSFGHEDYSEVIVIKDLISPIVSINSPVLNELFGSTPPNFDISITESNPDLMWYTLDSGAINITFGSLIGTIDQAEWNKQGNGTVTVKFYARDEGGNVGFAEITVRKDINIPLITINTPITDDLFGPQPPQYDVSVVEPNIDSMWYTLDNGITMIPFSEFTGTIDQTEWDKFGDGIVIIRFYVRDKGDNEAYTEVSVNKDLIAPAIIINEPEFGEVFVDISPLYSITILETSLESYWYSFDDGLTNHSISELTGAISQSVWDTLPDGHVTLKFYAKDEAGNVGQSSVTITKRTTSEPLPPGIPGYDIYLLLGALSVISLIIIRKRVNS